MSKPSYFVKDGHTLGYVYAEQPQFFNILHGNPILGGHDWRDGFVAIDPAIDQLVPATLADFETFRVSPAGHIV